MCASGTGESPKIVAVGRDFGLGVVGPGDDVLIAGDEDVLVDLLVAVRFQFFRVVPVGHEDGGLQAWSAGS